eukprot:m.113780 g.113780  ORF g.113780 m.113780 type:complete len:198 (-) comp10817_c0_seq2:348-941(-)
MAMLLTQQGEHLKAEEMHRTVHATSVQAFGPDDHRTLIAKANLAINLRAARDPIKTAEAIRIEREVLKARKKTLKPEDPTVLQSMAVVARDLYQRGQYARAAKLEKKIMVGVEQSCGADSEEFRKVAHDYSQTLLRLNRNDEAVELLRRAVRAACVVFGAGSFRHQEMADSLTEALADQGKMEDVARVRTQVVTFGA